MSVITLGDTTTADMPELAPGLMSRTRRGRPVLLLAGNIHSSVPWVSSVAMKNRASGVGKKEPGELLPAPALMSRTIRGQSMVSGLSM